MKKSVCVLGIFALMLFMIGVVSATTLYADGANGADLNDCTSGSPCATIQQAIDRAADGDTVIVNYGSNGTYPENLIINKSIILKSSAGAGATLINGTINITGINASNTVIGGGLGKGFEFSNGTNVSSAGELYLILIESGATSTAFGPGNVTISYNTFNVTHPQDTNNSISGINGLSIIGISIKSNISGLNIYNNTFRLSNHTGASSNHSQLSTSGIVADDAYDISGINISDNTFISKVITFYNETGIHIAIFNVSTTPSLISGNTFTSLTEAIVIGSNATNTTTGTTVGAKFGSSYLKISNNTFFMNNVSIGIISAYDLTANKTQDIRITNNNFSRMNNAGIDINGSTFYLITFGNYLHPSNFTISNNTFESGLSNSVGIKNAGASQTVIAASNWWGDKTGPGGARTAAGYGGAGNGTNVTRYVDFSPWCNLANCSTLKNIQVNYTSIENNSVFNITSSAIGNASTGDTIEIRIGTYNESNILVNKQISIIGENLNAVIKPTNCYNAFNITANNVLIQNLNITINNSGVVYSQTGGTINNDTYDQNSTSRTSEIYAINILKSNNVTINNTVINMYGNRTIGIRAGGPGNGSLPFSSGVSNDVITNLTIINNQITIRGTGVGIYAAPANATNGFVHSEWVIGGATTGNVITLKYGEGNCMELYDVNNSVVSYNNLTSNITDLGKTNFIWASVLQNISELRFVHNIVNGTQNNTPYEYGLVIFRNNTASTLYNINFTYNTVENWGPNVTAVWFDRRGVNSASVKANYNSFSNAEYTTGYAMKNNDTTAINATLNWWGDADGVGGNSTSGGRVSTYITYDPWYTNAAKTTVHAGADAAAAAAAAASNPSGSLPAVVDWTMTYIASEEELGAEDGYTKELGTKNRVKFKIGEDYHHVGVTALTSSTVTIEISSEVQEANLVVGDIRKFDVTNDGFYDLSIVLNAIANNKADITIKKISEEVTEISEEEEAAREEEAEKLKEVEEEAAAQKRVWTWIIVGIVVIVLILIGIGYGVKKKKRR